MYEMIGLPPVDEGAVQVTDAVWFPADDKEIAGAPGVVAGVAGADGLDGEEVPYAFVAVTTNV
jgi:hypothetical protein